MSDEFKLRKDIDEANEFIDEINRVLQENDSGSFDDLLSRYYDKSEIDTFLLNLSEKEEEGVSKVQYKLWSSSYNPLVGEDISLSVQVTDSNGGLMSNHEFDLIIDDTTIIPLTTNENGYCSYEYYCGKQGSIRVVAGSSNIYLNVDYYEDWTEITLNSGYEGNPKYNNVCCKRVGNIVRIYGAWKPTSEKTASSSGVPFGKLPPLFCPQNTNQYSIQQAGGINKYLLTIFPNGDICWSKYGTSSSINLPAGINMIIDITYLI